MQRRSKFTAFIADAIAYCGDDCLLWPWYKNQGYGRTWRGYVHVLVCEAVHGPRPDGHTAMHTCNHHACVNPAHLRWHATTPAIGD